MFHINTLKLREKILLGYGIPILLTIVASSVVLFNAKIVEQQNQGKDESSLIVRVSDQLEMFVAKRQRDVRGYLFTRDKAYLQEYQKNAKNFRETGQRLAQLLGDDDLQQIERLKRVLIIGEKLHNLNQRLFQLTEANKTAEILQILQAGQHQELTAEMADILKQINDIEDRRYAERERSAQSAMRMLLVATIAGTVVSAILAVVIGVFLASRISRTINEIVSVVGKSSAEIAVAMEQQERAVTNQTASVRQVSTTMDELSASARQSAEQANAASQSSQQVLSLVDETTYQMRGNNLKAKVNQIAEQILHLSEQTSQIGNISNIVSELANQTNMLALNAAVEAVRAGEQGKGFSVVAVEIRKLADQSRKSAERINSLVDEIQRATNSTVMVTDEGAKMVFTIIEAISQVTQNSQQISLTAKQQAIAIQEVVKAMNDLSLSAIQTSDSISQTRVGTQKLNEATIQLKAVV